MTKAVIPPCFAPGTTHVSPRSNNTQTVDLGGSDQDDSIIYLVMHCILQRLAQCASLSGYEEDTQRTWSVTLLAPDA